MCIKRRREDSDGEERILIVRISRKWKGAQNLLAKKSRSHLERRQTENGASDKLVIKLIGKANAPMEEGKGS